MLRTMLAILVWVTLGLTATPALAQLPGTGGDGGEEAATLPDPLTPEAVRNLVAGLSDDQVRALLLEHLDSVAEANANVDDKRAGFLEFARQAASGTVSSVVTALERLPVLWTLQAQSFSTFWDRVGWQGLGIMLTVMSVAIAAGLAAEFLFRRLTRRWVESSGAGGQSLRGTVMFLIKRLTQDLVSVVIFIEVAQWIGIFFGLRVFGDIPVTHQLGGYMGLIWWNLIAMPRLGAAFSRFLLAPKRPEHRLVHTDDATAKYLHRNQIGLFVLMGFSIAIVVFNAQNGVSMGESRLGFWLNLAVHIYIVVVVWRAWDGLIMMMRGADDDVTRAEEWAARAYPWFGIGVSVGTWFLVNIIAAFGHFELLQGAPHYMMMILLLMAPAVDTLIRGLVRHLVPPMAGEGPLAEKAYRSTKRSYIRIGRVIAFGIVVLMIGRIWGLDLHNLAAAGVGAQFAGRLIEILIILAVGYLVMEIVSLWINRKLAAEQTAAALDPSQDEMGGEGGTGTGDSRLSTVLPLLLGVLKITVLVIFGLIALGNIGIDITPLLAGAGIAGLAIGFGAQKLVTDVVSGIFFLVDDAFRTGEYVEVDGTFGTVEKISIRSMQLRHHKGPVHTIPYGEIPKLTNYSRDWVIMKIRFTVPFDTDPNKVKKIFKQIGKDMMEVPEYATDLLQPFKSQGVFDFDDVGMIIRGKFMAKPGRQFVLRKEIYNRVKQAFEANGITFARREVRVAIPGLEETTKLSDDDKAAIAAAASDAATQAAEAQKA